MLNINDHSNYIKICVDLAFSVVGKVSPNPYVACIIVLDGEIKSVGIHQGAGNPHAEVNALNALPKCYDRSKCTLYVNLEPCCHFNKRTPPCAQLLIKEGIKKVVIGCLDPNPFVSGNGVKLLRDNGVEVLENIENEISEKLNKIFFKNINKKVPYFYGKIASSLDGKISLLNGDSKWITGEKSRILVHDLRMQFDAIMVGKKTFLADLPSLNSRKNNNIQKENIKIIVGNYKQIIPLINNDKKNFYIVISQNKESNLNFSEIKIINDIKVIFYQNSIQEVFARLLEMGICSVFVEGGGELFTHFLEKNLLDEISIFKAPIIIGTGKGFSNSLDINSISESIKIKKIKYEQLDNDIHITGIL